jgi:hypothetical protein
MSWWCGRGERAAAPPVPIAMRSSLIEESGFVQPFSGEDSLASNKADAFLP